jgi:hypothetical protein
LAVSNGTLIVGGDFTTIGGIAADHIARWDGGAFSAIHGGTDGPVYALAPYHDEIQAGGEFTAVRNGRAGRFPRVGSGGLRTAISVAQGWRGAGRWPDGDRLDHSREWE